MHALIVANGRIGNKNFYKKVIKEADIIIAADGGADNCIKLGIIPNYVVGDLDSISKKAKKKFRNILMRNPSQNSTDMEKAVSLAKKCGCKKLSVIGAIGSRLDHTIANIYSLLKINVPSEILDENNNIYLVENEIELKGKKDDIVSIIPISDVKGLTYTGLKWRVSNKNINAGWIGISNLMLGRRARIKLKSGKIIVIKTGEK